MVRPPRFVVEIRIGPDAQGVKNGRCQIGRRERLSGRNATVSVGPANNPSRLDATTGQNAHSQVETFQSMCNVTGLILTKLDGSAKGGVLVALAEKFDLPVHAIGVGEGEDDLHPFEAGAFARALVGLDG